VTKRIKHPSEMLKKGDEYRRSSSASTRQPEAEPRHQAARTGPLEDWFNRHQLGQAVKGRIARMTNFGAFVELEEGIEGCATSPSSMTSTVEKPTEFLNVGQEVEMRIIKLNLAEKKIGLSLKAMKEENRGSNSPPTWHRRIPAMPAWGNVSASSSSA